jgi:hypothetical protein
LFRRLISNLQAVTAKQFASAKTQFKNNSPVRELDPAAK